MFIDEQTQNKIFANLDESVSHGTMRNYDLLFTLCSVIQCTPEFLQIFCTTTYYRAEHLAIEHNDSDDFWNSEEMNYLMEELFDVLDMYAPDGYYFGAHEGDGSDFGYWKIAA